MTKKRTRAARSKEKKTPTKRLEPGASPISGVAPPVEHQFKEGNQAAVGHGRPRKMQDLKELILETLAENGGILDGEPKTRAQLMIRTMLIKSPSDRIALLEYAFGAVPKPTHDMNENEWRDWLTQNGKDPEKLIAEFVAHMGGGGNSESSVPADATDTDTADPVEDGDAGRAASETS